MYATSCCCAAMLQGGSERVSPQGLLYKDLPHFVNADGNYIFCRYWEPPTPPRGLVMILHGAGEHSGRYSEVVEMLVKHSLFVFAHDHVGHGQSEGERMAVSDFRVYIRDALQHFDIMTKNYPDLRVFLVAHSMGGLIAIYLANERQDNISGAVLIAPLVLMNPETATPIKIFCAKVMNHVLPNVPLGYMEHRWISREEKEVTDYINDPLNYHGPVRVRFAVVLLRAVDKLEKVLPTISTPMLILHGDADKLCDVRGAYLLHDKAASADKTLKIFKKSFHQLHRELPSVTAEVFAEIENWLEDRLPPIEQ